MKFKLADFDTICSVCGKSHIEKGKTWIAGLKGNGHSNWAAKECYIVWMKGERNLPEDLRD